MMTQQAVALAGPCIQIIPWEDIFVVIDDGSGRPSDYEVLQRMVTEQSARYPSGLGCLAIIPANARPPSDAARKALNAALAAAPLRCICWLVEGSGFQAAMVRAILTGLRFVDRRPYPTHTADELEEAIKWMLAQLGGGNRRFERATAAVAMIRTKRASGLLRSI